MRLDCARHAAALDNAGLQKRMGPQRRVAAALLLADTPGKAA